MRLLPLIPSFGILLFAMTVDLTECRAKIERANEHREELNAIVAPLLNWEAELFQMSAKLDPESGYHVFRVAAVPEEWRLEVGVILGDIVHNLRSALDYLFWQLYCHYIRVPRSPREAEQVQFPIEDTKNRLANKRVHFNKIPPSQWALIDSAQPYNGSHHPSRAIKALRDLSNRDKHQVLNPPLLTSMVVSFADTVPTHRATAPLRVPDPPKRLEVGAEVVRMPFPPDVDAEVEMAGYVFPTVRLPEMDTTLIRGVDIMIHAVRLIVESIEAEL
jgi:hypothetical protein